MQRLFDKVRDRLAGFVEQRDAIALLIPCPDEAMPVVLKQIDGLDEASSVQMYWSFSDPFVDAESYVASIVESFATRHEAVRLGMPQLGLTPWPPLPERLRDPARSAVRRLRETMVFARSLLHDPQEMTTVFALLPLEIHDPLAHAALIAAVLEHSFPMPWCHHLRILVRSDADRGPMATHLQGTGHIAWYEPELDADAVQRTLAQDAFDRALPMPQRMQSLFLTAELDYAYQRFGAALAKLEVLLKFFIGTRDLMMTALVLNALGETHAREGRAEQAGQCFEWAFVPASRAPGPPLPVLLNIVVNLGTLRSGQARWVEARAYWDSAQQLATAQRDAATKLRAIEELGVCHARLGDATEARRCWSDGLEVATALGMEEPQRSLRERLGSGMEAMHSTPDERAA